VKRNFLVVAANEQVREALAGDLRAKGYSVTRAVSGAEAERVVRSVAVDAVLVESSLPDMTGEELTGRVKKIRPDCRSVILTSFEHVRNTPEQLRFGSGDYLLRASQVIDLLHAPYVAAREGSTSNYGKRATDSLIQVIDIVVGLLELDDRHFGGFSHQAMDLARAVAEELSDEEETIQEVVLAALLRDIGKAGVDSAILDETGWFTDEQREAMQGHVNGSVRLLEHVDFPWKVLPIIRHHHERYDGKGYPDGLRGRAIPMGARIVAVVDAYVALTSGRHHRGAFDGEQALTMLVSEAGRQFDPEVVEAFQKVLDKRRGGREKKRKPRILIADAHDEFRKLFRMRLLNDGCDVLETDDYEQALGTMLQESPDLVLLDLDADQAAAFRLLEEIRQDDALRRVPMALLSRSSDRILKIRALRMGVDDFLAKDSDLDELAARVENILTREAVRRESAPQAVRRGITGDLENLGLPEIIQTLVMGMKTACVTLRRNGAMGRIWLDNGAARHAQTGELEGDPAFYEMVGWSSGEFVIEHGVKCKRSTLTRDAMYLLMEGLRMIDESQGKGTQAAS